MGVCASDESKNVPKGNVEKTAKDVTKSVVVTTKTKKRVKNVEKVTRKTFGDEKMAAAASVTASRAKEKAIAAVESKAAKQATDAVVTGGNAVKDVIQDAKVTDAAVSGGTAVKDMAKDAKVVEAASIAGTTVKETAVKAMESKAVKNATSVAAKGGATALNDIEELVEDAVEAFDSGADGQIEDLVRELWETMEELDEESAAKFEAIGASSKALVVSISTNLKKHSTKIGSKIFTEISKFANANSKIAGVDFMQLAKTAGLIGGSALLLAAHAAAEVLFIMKPLMVIIDAFRVACSTDQEVQTILARMLKMTTQLWGIMLSGVAERCRGIEGKQGVLSKLKTEVRRVLNVVLTVLTRMKQQHNSDGVHNSMEILVKGSNIITAIIKADNSKETKRWVDEKISKVPEFQEKKFWIEAWPNYEPDGQTINVQCLGRIYGRKNVQLALHVDHVESIISEDMPEEPLKAQVREEIKKFLGSKGLEKKRKKKSRINLNVIGAMKGISSFVGKTFRNAYNASDRKDMFLELEKGLDNALKCAHFQSTLMVMDTVTQNNKILLELYKFHKKVNECHKKIENKDLQKIWEDNFPHLQLVDIQDLAPPLAKWLKSHEDKHEETRRKFQVTRKDLHKRSFYDMVNEVEEMLVFLDNNKGRGESADSKVHYMEANVWFPKGEPLINIITRNLKECKDWWDEYEMESQTNIQAMEEGLNKMLFCINEDEKRGNITNSLVLRGLRLQLKRKLKKEKDIQQRNRNQKYSHIISMHKAGPKSHSDRYKVASGLLVMAKKECILDLTALPSNQEYKIALQYLRQASQKDDENERSAEAIMLLVNVLWDRMDISGEYTVCSPEIRSLLRVMYEEFKEPENKVTGAFYLSLLAHDLFLSQMENNAEREKKSMSLVRGVYKNKKKWKKVKESIQKGDADLDLQLQYGIAVLKLEELAWCETAFDTEKKGHIIANLAFLYQNVGDYKKKEECLHIGAELGDPICLYNLADTLKGHRGGYAETVKYLEIAAKLNHYESLKRLGCYFLEDKKRKGVERNENKALDYFERASKFDTSLLQLVEFLRDLLAKDGTIAGSDIVVRKRILNKLKKLPRDNFAVGLLEGQITKTFTDKVISKSKPSILIKKSNSNDSNYAPVLFHDRTTSSSRPGSPSPNISSSVASPVSNPVDNHGNVLTPRAALADDTPKEAQKSNYSAVLITERKKSKNTKKPSIAAPMSSGEDAFAVAIEDEDEEEEAFEGTNDIFDAKVADAAYSEYKKEMKKGISREIIEEKLCKAVMTGHIEASTDLYRYIDRKVRPTKNYKKMEELLKLIAHHSRGKRRYQAAYRLSCYYRDGRPAGNVKKEIPVDQSLQLQYLRIKLDEFEDDTCSYSSKNEEMNSYIVVLSCGRALYKHENYKSIAKLRLGKLLKVKGRHLIEYLEGEYRIKKSGATKKQLNLVKVDFAAIEKGLWDVHHPLSKPSITSLQYINAS